MGITDVYHPEVYLVQENKNGQKRPSRIKKSQTYTPVAHGNVALLHSVSAFYRRVHRRTRLWRKNRRNYFRASCSSSSTTMVGYYSITGSLLHAVCIFRYHLGSYSSPDHNRPAIDYFGTVKFHRFTALYIHADPCVKETPFIQSRNLHTGAKFPV